jgi:hypothetical protein
MTIKGHMKRCKVEVVVVMVVNEEVKKWQEAKNP